MARLPNNRPGKYINNPEVNINKQKIVDGEVIEYVNDEGDTFVFKKTEVEDVIVDMVDETIRLKNIKLYSEVENKLNTLINRQVEQLSEDMNTILNNRIDNLAEKIFVKTLNYKIEDEVSKALDTMFEDFKNKNK